MSLLGYDKDFFRYLVSKIVQTTPSNETPEVYSEQVFQRAVRVFEKVKEYEKINNGTEEYKTNSL